MIQKQPKVYKLDGGDKLRIAQALPEAAARFETVERLLNTLSA